MARTKNKKKDSKITTKKSDLKKQKLETKNKKPPVKKPVKRKKKTTLKVKDNWLFIKPVVKDGTDTQQNKLNI